MQVLLRLFHHPEKSFFSILIAGTKGKGSTGFFLESILKENGISSGFYSSPHLEDPRERIRMHGKMISEKDWAEGLAEIQKVLKKHQLPSSKGQFTYFEIMTLLAMLVFKKKKVKVGIFEIGMGGRLDATNVLPAKLVILTPIDLDHESFLGKTVQKIAREKAGIIKGSCEAIVTSQKPEAEREVDQRIRSQQARKWEAEKWKGKTGLYGDHQRINAGAAYKAAQVLGDVFNFPIHDPAIHRGIQSQNWPGRFELIRKNPPILLDAAHNPASAKVLVAALKKHFPQKKAVLVFAASRDKRSDLMLKELSRYFSEVIVTSSANTRSQEVDVLTLQARPYFKMILPIKDRQEAFQMAKLRARGKKPVVVTGSFYLLGEIRKSIQHA